MGMKIPAWKTSLLIYRGPGATRLLDAALKLHAIGGRAYAGHPGPKLYFTVEDPVGPAVTAKVRVEVLSDLKKVDDHYEMCITSRDLGVFSARVMLWLRETPGLGFGRVLDFS